MTDERSVTERLLALLQENHADFVSMTHEPVRTSEEAAQVRGTPLEQGAKALVYRADGRPVLLVLQAHRRVNSRAVKQALGVKDLRMVSPEDLREMTGMEVGAVPPFGSLLGLPVFVDERLLDLPRISFNAGSRTTSVVMAPADYQRLEQPTSGRFASDDQPE